MDRKPTQHRRIAWEFPHAPGYSGGVLLWEWGVWRFGRVAIPFYIIFWPYAIFTAVSTMAWFVLSATAANANESQSQQAVQNAQVVLEALPWLTPVVLWNLAFIGVILVGWVLRAIFRGVASEIRTASKGYR